MKTNNTGLPPKISLEGGINFRDLAGIPASGGVIQRCHFFRSGALDLLTKNDTATLEKIPLKHVIDYRDPGEALARPDVFLRNTQSDLVPANPVLGANSNGANLRKLAAEVLENGDAPAFMHALYSKLPFENPAYRHMIATALKLENGAMLQHCMIGKDRTGVGTAILLLALGVARENILEDYLKTEKELAPFRAREEESYAREFGSKKTPEMTLMLSARPEFLQATFDAIDDRFGDSGTFLRTEFGLTPRKLEIFRKRHLQ